LLMKLLLKCLLLGLPEPCPFDSETRDKGRGGYNVSNRKTNTPLTDRYPEAINLWNLEFATRILSGSAIFRWEIIYGARIKMR